MGSFYRESTLTVLLRMNASISALVVDMVRQHYGSQSISPPSLLNVVETQTSQMQLVATFWKATLLFQVFRLESKHRSEEFGPRSYTVRLPAVESAGRRREDDIPKANDATLNFLFGKKSFVFLNSLDNIGILSNSGLSI